MAYSYQAEGLLKAVPYQAVDGGANHGWPYPKSKNKLIDRMANDQATAPTTASKPHPDVRIQTSPSGGGIDIEISKLKIETERLRIDRDKVDLDKKNSRINFYVAIFTAVFGGGVLAAFTTYQNAERLKFDIESKRVEQRQRDEDLLFKKNESEQAKDALRVDLLKKYIDSITSQDADAERKLMVLAKLILPTEADTILAQARVIRDDLLQKEIVAARTEPSSSIHEDPTESETAPPLVIRYSNSASVPAAGQNSAIDYVAEGKHYLGAKKYEQALSSFDKALTQIPNDPLVWNFKAYSEFRSNRFDSALESIIQAVKLNPSDNKTRRWVAINTTKILCAQNRENEAATYFNQSTAVVPEIVADVQRDGEFQTTCRAIWRG
jgi:tetratricopeptide (TPR) repeat protein